MAMADGYAQATGRPAHVNLHTAPGTGNGMGNLVTAWHNKTPLIVTAGQQTREMLLIEPRLASRRAAELTQPYVKWAHEPVRAQDIPAALMRAYATAVQPPAGPVFLSLPLDDWERPADPAPQVRGGGHPVRAGPGPAARLRHRRWRPAAPRCWCSARRWTGPAPGRRRSPWPSGWPRRSGPRRRRSGPSSPRTTRTTGACCRTRSGRWREALRGHDTVLVVGAPVFRYYPHVPGDYLPDGAAAAARHRRPGRGGPGPGRGQPARRRRAGPAPRCWTCCRRRDGHRRPPP